MVVPALAAAGHTIRLLDFRPIDTAHELLQGDLRNPDDLARAVDGVDAAAMAWASQAPAPNGAVMTAFMTS